jgi:cell wall-associated NlpC family hydrolase
MRDKIVQVAKTWIDTPFHHNQRVKYHGVDCINLIIGIGQELGICGHVPSNILSYGQRPNPRHLIDGLELFFDRIHLADVKKGDFCAVSWRKNLPMHVAMYIGDNQIIHTSQSSKKVIQVYWDNNFLTKIHSWWCFKGVV